MSTHKLLTPGEEKWFLFLSLTHSKPLLVPAAWKEENFPRSIQFFLVSFLNKLQTNTTSVHLQLYLRLTILWVSPGSQRGMETRKLLALSGLAANKSIFFLSPEYPPASCTHNVVSYSISRAWDASIDNYCRQGESSPWVCTSKWNMHKAADGLWVALEAEEKRERRRQNYWESIYMIIFRLRHSFLSLGYRKFTCSLKVNKLFTRYLICLQQAAFAAMKENEAGGNKLQLSPRKGNR